MKIFKSVQNGNFAIQRGISLIDFKSKAYTIWEDPYEEFDFTMIDDRKRFPDLPSEFVDEKKAHEYLEKKFGKLKKLSNR